MKDSEVLDRIGRGDERALDYLYKKHYRMMVNVVMKNNGTEIEAQDIYQEALVAFWQKAASGKLVLTSTRKRADRLSAENSTPTHEKRGKIWLKAKATHPTNANLL